MEPLEYISNGVFCSRIGNILVTLIMGRVVHLAVIILILLIINIVCTIRSVLFDHATPFGVVLGWRGVVVVIISVN